MKIKKMVELKRLYKTSHLCDMLEVTRQTIYKWRQAGMPVAIDNTADLQGKTIRYDIDDVMNWLNRNRWRDDTIHYRDTGDEDDGIDSDIHDHPLGAGFAQKDYK